MKTSLGESVCWARVPIPLWPIVMALILILHSYPLYLLLITRLTPFRLAGPPECVSPHSLW